MPDDHQTTGEVLRNFLMIAWLAPLAGFLIEVLAGYWQRDRRSKAAAYLAVGCIGLGFVCSLCAFLNHRVYTRDAKNAAEAAAKKHDSEPKKERGEKHAENTAEGKKAEHGNGHADVFKPKPFSGTIYILAHFGDLKLSIDYYIDTLTLVMFMMVTLIATCIHVFALGYMSDELTDDHVDHEVHLSNGKHLHRPGRFYTFFAYMSLFCFSMLGLVLAGNIFQVFIFWELVGICSYLLIGFYIERKSASTAANKAFIMNRVGDFGFLIGLMILWTSCGTFSFGEWNTVAGPDGHTERRHGLFQMVGGEHGKLNVVEQDGERIVKLDTGNAEKPPDFGADPAEEKKEEPKTIPYWLLVVAGLGIFAGCIGKSAQFPLQTWLPDAMEGPTPVSALVHSATMVAAGVYLAGRFFPVFTPEVLLVIAYVGCITLFLAATIAVVATDIKRVLAYSTISQLGYMMLAIGVAGWSAGLFHLITHAFFKSLMFLCAGSVIVGCHHEQEMTRMGGLWRKMPITAFTMLVGVIAISGLAIPGWEYYHLGLVISLAANIWLIVIAFRTSPTWGVLLLVVPGAVFIALLWLLLSPTYTSALVFCLLWLVAAILPLIFTVLNLRRAIVPLLVMLIAAPLFAQLHGAAAFSGYHSKDAIVATALAYTNLNGVHFLLFWVPLITAGITAFYMFRLWFYTFAGKPRDEELHNHVHESPAVMTLPLIALALFAAFCAGKGGAVGDLSHMGSLFSWLMESEPVALAKGVAATASTAISLPGHGEIHDVHGTAGVAALTVAFAGTFIAFFLYGMPVVNPEEIKRQFSGIHSFLVEKWQFDRLYDVMFVYPVHVVSSWCTWIDKNVFDRILHGCCHVAIDVSRWDRKFDEGVVDRLVNLVGDVVFSVGRSLRAVQTGKLRQYVMFIAVGVLTLFVLLFSLFPQG